MIDTLGFTFDRPLTSLSNSSVLFPPILAGYWQVTSPDTTQPINRAQPIVLVARFPPGTFSPDSPQPVAVQGYVNCSDPTMCAKDPSFSLSAYPDFVAADGAAKLIIYVLFDRAPGIPYSMNSVIGLANEYHGWASEIKVAAPPRLFTIGAEQLEDVYQLMYNDTDYVSNFAVNRKRLHLSAITLANLGINSLIADNWAFNLDPDTLTGGNGLPPEQVNNILDSLGLKYRSCDNGYALYSTSKGATLPYHYLAFVNYYLAAFDKSDPKSVSAVQDLVTCMIIKQRLNKYQGHPVAELVEFKLWDEQYFCVPMLYDTIYNYKADGSTIPTDLTSYLGPVDFQTLWDAYEYYLKSIDIFPDTMSDYWGTTDFSEVQPIGSSTGNSYFKPHATEVQRHIFYHTLRFLHQQAAEAMRTYAQAITQSLISKGYPSCMYLWVNPNFFDGATTMGGLLGGAIYNPDQITSRKLDTLNISLSYFDLGRMNAIIEATDHCNCYAMWSEAIGNSGMEVIEMTFYAQLQRSNAMSGLADDKTYPKPPEPGEAGAFGIYLKPLNLFSNMDELLYRLMSVVGKGGKLIHYWGYGFGNSGNMWSDSRSIYNKIAQANGLLANVEDTLFYGRPSRSQICLLVTKSSDYYLGLFAQYAMYQQERINICVALAHAGYQVDLIDEDDILAGKLDSRQYRVLYLTDPNLPTACATEIATWVNAGGMLAVAAGAAVSDEFNQPSGIIDDLLGVNTRTDIIYQIGIVRALTTTKVFFDGLGITTSEYDNIMMRPFQSGLANSYIPDQDELGKTLQLKGTSTIMRDPIAGTPFFVTEPVMDPFDHKTPLNHLEPLGTTETPYTLFSDHVSFPAVTSRRIPNSAGIPTSDGYAFGYAFFPGLQYMHSHAPQTGNTVMASGYIKDIRDMVLQPVMQAELQPTAQVLKSTDNFVSTTSPEIEVNMLSSSHGYAITLLNWEGKDFHNKTVQYRVTVTINAFAHLYNVTSMHGYPCSYSCIGSDATTVTLQITLSSPFTVDVVTITKKK